MKQKLLRLLQFWLLITLYPLSWLVPRRSDLWVFGCYNNKFLDNSKYLFLWISEYRKDIDAVWITGDRAVAGLLLNNGYRACTRWSAQGLWLSLRARVYIFSSYLSDINYFTSGGALRVNLWHGVGLKSIEYKVSAGKLAKLYHGRVSPLWRLLLPERFAKPDLFLAPSVMMAKHFAECFRISPAACIQLPYPRLNTPRYPQLAVAVAALGDYAGLREDWGSFDRVAIYVPTWRDDGSSAISSGLPDLAVLSAALRQSNTLLYIKPHPVEASGVSCELANIRIWPRALDMYPLLADFDLLITDYSSVLYDYLYAAAGPVVLYNFDYNRYISQCRDLAFNYTENVWGLWVSNFAALCDVLARPAGVATADSLAQRQVIAERFFGAPVADPMERLVATIAAAEASK
ncbi:CDP-glycerol glycerophosphotransferase family protein [Amantichitinum ursilacus]|uniref:CDP-Glycerol:Poly(Glycerophosphate) glycerophosphotransferase n=1 Tax=Amantichitinum ursilacus TaxID=857265 RepID=A0A0N0XJZ8_9NEIS|nr:CDP-glycerol glycerophosphotransferase family protein [Amantichitinum ursilacus]KPC52204.1 CDP-Glycerol:Poly(glycerophosphate) glycerophosphotransferase [Amantichitinum ursilacus]